MQLKQRIPNWADASPKVAEGSLAEVLDTDWVSEYKRGIMKKHGAFVRFSRSNILLMAEYEDGFWPVGYVSDPDEDFSALPVWVSDRMKSQ